MDEGRSTRLAQLASEHGLTIAVVERIVQRAGPASAPLGDARFQDLGLLGLGGSGEVRRVLDPTLGRTMALKLLRVDPLEDPDARARFAEEARITAQLEHPGVLPVHALGHLEDGTPWFTMKEVRGRTLQLVIQEVHAAATAEGWRPAPSGWTFRRLLDAFYRACQTVAYAHSRGILHRDLKPQNLMVGDYGELLVLDWGLAQVMGTSEAPSQEAGPQSRARPLDTSSGEISGTPSYMSPEQAQGRHRSLTPASDVYALGAVLFEILTGKPPYRGPTPLAILARVLQGRREALVGPAPLPGELVALCDQAMRPRPEDRPADAGVLSAAMADFLEGARKRERALEMVAAADRAREESAALLARARARRQEAAAILAPLERWTPFEQKLPGWRLEDEADALERAASLAVLDCTQRLAAALEESPDLPEAHQRLADHYQALHASAEAAGDERVAAGYELLLRAHDRGAHASWLQGDGALTLITEPAGAEALLFRYELQDRRLVPVPVRSLGRTPLLRLPLARGSYLVVLRLPGRAEVRYPVSIGRGEHWDGAPPGQPDPLPIRLPDASALGPDEVYVPAGWFATGERDRQRVPGSLAPGRMWVGAFVVRRFPLTHGELLGLLNHLVEQGRIDEALRLAPRLRDSEAPAYARDDRGRFLLQRDPQGDLWEPDWPAFLLSWTQARGIAAALATRAGLPWRLLREAEWEKAARGVDGRRFPWGEHAEPTWASVRECAPGRILPAAVRRFPFDESPYGVRGMAGGVTDWCSCRFSASEMDSPGASDEPEDAAVGDPDAQRVARGGAFSQFVGSGQLARRVGLDAAFRDYAVGLRLARALT